MAERDPQTASEAECERFLDGIVAHHRRRDEYPDPRTVGAELGYPLERTEAVLGGLWERRWIARSPYAADRIRITPRGWEYLCHRQGAATVAVFHEEGDRTCISNLG